ncbi:MAG: hypothetical protein KC466_12910 [Myxococcales bacterium]|nr:hypothetical protein [Myxococcales bacterium]
MRESETRARDRWELYALGRSLAETLRAGIEDARAAGRLNEGAYARALERHARVEAILRRILADLGEGEGVEAPRG